MNMSMESSLNPNDWTPEGKPHKCPHESAGMTAGTEGPDLAVCVP